MELHWHSRFLVPQPERARQELVSVEPRAHVALVATKLLEFGKKSPHDFLSAAKDLGITQVVVVVVFHSSHLKGIKVKKLLHGRDSNRGPFPQQSSALPTELQ